MLLSASVRAGEKGGEGTHGRYLYIDLGAARQVEPAWRMDVPTVDPFVLAARGGTTVSRAGKEDDCFIRRR